VQKIRELLQALSFQNHSAYDAFVLVILSHGNKDGVYGTNGARTNGEPAEDAGFVLLDEITSFFDGSKCPSLGGKPKMFFIQACQGGDIKLVIFLLTGIWKWNYLDKFSICF